MRISRFSRESIVSQQRRRENTPDYLALTNVSCSNRIDSSVLVEGTPLEHRIERDEEDGYDCKAAQFVGIAAP